MSDERTDVKSFYDEYGERLGLTEDYEHLEPVLPDISSTHVLDAGCGLGNGSAYLAAKGAEVTGIDLSEEEITIARGRHGNDLEFYQADLRDPLNIFEDGQFDVIVCALVLAHIEDLDRLFSEFSRILTEGGTVVIHAHHPFVDYLELEVEESDQVIGRGTTYAETEEFSRPWGPDGAAMPLYRRPLGELLRPPQDAGFVLEQIVEPGTGPTNSDRYDPSRPPRHLLLRFRC